MANWQPRFFSIWFGQAFSLVGSALTQFVLVWWITQSTRSPAALALAGIMGLLPTALFSPLGGALADRFSRRKIMILTDAITAACIGVLVGLFALGRVQLWQVYVLMFVRAAMQSFQQPAAAASTTNLVPANWLRRVAGMNQVLQGVMTIAAAPLGALALAVLPIQGALLIDVATALLGITPLFFYAIPQPRKPDACLTPGLLLKDVRSGVEYVKTRPGLLHLYLVTGLVVLTVMPTFSLTPLLVTQHFKGGVNEVAFMESFAGIGVIAGGIFISIWPLLRRGVVTILVSFALSCATVALTALMPSSCLGLATAWWAISGFTFSTGNAPLTAILQKGVPNELQGRVLALLNMVTGLAGPVGLVVAGPLGEAIGVQGVFLLGGSLSALVCLSGLFSKSLYHLEPPDGLDE